jgi:hypothetical protein
MVMGGAILADEKVSDFRTHRIFSLKESKTINSIRQSRPDLSDGIGLRHLFFIFDDAILEFLSPHLICWL